MSSFAYTARLAPLHRDISLPGEKGGPLVLDEQTWRTWMETPWHVGVRVSHDPGNVGICSFLRVRDGWYEADFILNDKIERNLPEGLPVGQPMSVGMRHFDSKVLLLQEISIVPHGAIRGAEVTSRRERKPTSSTSAAAVANVLTRKSSRTRTMPDGSVERDLPDGSVEITYPRGGPRMSRQCGQVVSVGGVPVGRGRSDLIRAIQALPDDGYSTLYDHDGRVLERIPW